jgi:hypothetical protein
MEHNEPEVMFFNLSSPLQFSKGGDFTTTSSLEFKAPTMDIFDDVSDLSQLIMAAIMDARKYASPSEMTESVPDASGDGSAAAMDDKAIKVILMSSREVKFKDVANCFKKVAFKTGTTDGTVKLTDMLLNKLSREDFTRLVCQYVSTFIVPFLL